MYYYLELEFLMTQTHLTITKTRRTMESLIMRYIWENGLQIPLQMYLIKTVHYNYLPYCNNVLHDHKSGYLSEHAFR